MNFSQKLRSARLDNQMNQAELARASRLTRGVISKWESGESKNPSAVHVLRVAKALAVSPQWLLNDAVTERRA